MAGPPEIRSGARYSGVPSTAPPALARSGRDRPKSSSLTTRRAAGLRTRKMFSVLMSPWMIARVWM